jgi:hypothetical protein
MKAHLDPSKEWQEQNERRKRRTKSPIRHKPLAQLGPRGKRVEEKEKEKKKTKNKGERRRKV